MIRSNQSLSDDATAQKRVLLRLVWVGMVSMMLLAACAAPTPTPEPVSIRFRAAHG